MKNGHNDVLAPIRAIPFVFSTNSDLASGFSRLRLFLALVERARLHGVAERDSQRASDPAY
jgi:hypothetical protein